MVTAATKCPKCGCHDFASPREVHLDADITCLECGYICTFKQALDAPIAGPQIPRNDAEKGAARIASNSDAP